MKIEKFPKEVSEELAEETGWHIGDGSMNYYKNHKKMTGLYQLRGHIEDDRPHYIQRIKPIFKNLYGIDISLREMLSTRVFGFQIWSNDLVKFKQELGLKIGPKIDVVIPSKFLTEDKLKIAVIRGIFDTDGCVYLEKKNHKLYPRTQIVTISKKLAEQLKSIFIYLGLRATMHEDKSMRGNRKIFYAIVIRGEEMFHKFIEVISPQNPKHIAKYYKFTQSFK
jgi:DNA-binding transcriptional regulator WhiA